MRSCNLGAIALLILICGCVTPAQIKAVSSQQGENIVGLSEAMGIYSNSVTARFRRSFDLLGQAYVAAEIKDHVRRQKLGPEDSPDGNQVKDFFSAAEVLQAKSENATKEFELAMELAGECEFDGIVTVDSEVRRLMASYPEGESAKSFVLLKMQGKIPADEMAPDRGPSSSINYLHSLFELRMAHDSIQRELMVVKSQLELMAAWHAIVDHYLSIDAKVDGEGIANAANAGDVAGKLLADGELAKVLR